MYRRIFISTLLLMALLVSVVPAQAQPDVKPAEATSNDWAQFISDVTVPDGTNFAASTPFTKIWRLRNIGNSTWTSAFSVVFISGEMMSTVSPQFLTTNVIPGQTVDIAVNMVAPANPGAYQGFWALRNASGVLFGIGPTANSPFWVKITVGTGIPTSGVVYDFVANAGSVNWTSQTSTLPFPGNPIDPNGSAVSVSNPQLENGTTVATPGLEVRPNNTSNGFIRGVYPEFFVQPTDRFRATISCPYNAPGCNIFFRLDYQIGTGAISSFWAFRERADGLYFNADVDLSLLAGKNVKFILAVNNDGTYSDDDKGLWVAPRIERGSTSTIPPVPPPSTGCTDRVAFIADVTVPDGTVMVPNFSFTKTWRLKNIGTCTWTPAYSATFISGDPMNAVFPAPLTMNVAPGQSVDVSVNMVSPAATGSYRGNWALKNAVGTVFALGTNSNIPFWVLIRVGGGGPFPTPPPGACTNRAAFVSDVTIPDNSFITANTPFTKIWRLRNTGTCTWNTAYSTTFVSGDSMSAVFPVPLPMTVVPGQSVDVAVNMVAPSIAGTYKGNWSLRSDTGQNFALGSAANVPFFVLIQVLGSGPTPTPISPTATPLVTPTGVNADLSVTISNNKTTYTPGLSENYTITVTNNGPYAVTDASFSYKPSPAQISSFAVACTPDAGASCTPNPGLPSGATFTDLPDIPAFTKVIYTATVYNPSNAVGAMTNIASVSVPAGITDPNPGNNSATDTDVSAPVANLSVVTTGPALYTAGGTVVYIVTVSTLGPSDVTGALFGNSVTSQVGTWKVTCAGAGGATCTATSPDLSTGAGQTYWADTVNIPVGGSVVYTVTAQVNLSALGSLTNTSSIAVPAGVTDPVPANNTFVFTVNPP